jgi:hypothetical protein
MREIARVTLGNGDRFHEIYHLNERRYRPDYAVPAGTILVLPDGARVPPEAAVN